jgi:HD-GYP domain-containing protein (c-di-GMP phosphodiesterase class II)
VSELRDIVHPVKHHHENWDGSGYPDGLIGEAIPLSSRVIMFADTVDAMLSDRPYRAAMSRLQVRAEIIRMRGKQFDPGICDALLESPVWDELFTNAPQPVMTGEYPQLVPAARRVPA